MRPVAQSIAYGSHQLEYRLVRSDRRTMQISVHPDMMVEVIAPLTATEDAIRLRVLKRAPWILRQITYFRQFHPRTPARQYLAGETHLYLGRRYRLKVTHSLQEKVALRGGFIEIHTHYPKRSEHNQMLFDKWIKDRAREVFTRRLEKCLSRFPNPDDFQPRVTIVRRLKQRWGSMTPRARLILNRALIQASAREIDYVITHELCHLAYHHHGKEFYHLLTRVMPDWAHRKHTLEQRLA